jgi:hypothetical protein
MMDYGDKRPDADPAGGSTENHFALMRAGDAEIDRLGERRFHS